MAGGGCSESDKVAVPEGTSNAVGTPQDQDDIAFEECWLHARSHDPVQVEQESVCHKVGGQENEDESSDRSTDEGLLSRRVAGQLIVIRSRFCVDIKGRMNVLIERQRVSRRRYTPLRPKKRMRLPDIAETVARVSNTPLRVPTPVLWSLTAVVAIAGLAMVLPEVQLPTRRAPILLPADEMLDAIMLQFLSPGSEGELEGDLPPIQIPESWNSSVRTYEIQPGDVLGGIAARFGVSEASLININKITDVRRLLPGTIIKVPPSDGILYTVRNGDNLSAIADNHGVSVTAIADANDMASSVIFPGDTLFLPGARPSDLEIRRAMGTLFTLPTSGRFTSGFGTRRDPFTGRPAAHNGVDLANVVGTPVYAAREGTVAKIYNYPNGFGLFVIVRHTGGYQTVYAHLNRALVREGQWVNQGQQIAEMGSSGRSTGAHLHFAIMRNGVWLNPTNYVHNLF
jgi:murein DD-endopeptidase MepM/ murein hydrolase activator NlpD